MATMTKVAKTRVAKTEVASNSRRSSQTPKMSQPIENAIAVLEQLQREPHSKSEYYRRALATIASHLQADFATADIRSGASCISEAYRGAGFDPVPLSSIVTAVMLEAQADDAGLARRCATEDGQFLALSVPIHDHVRNELAGAVMVFRRATTESEPQIQSLLNELKQLVTHVDVFQQAPASTASAVSHAGSEAVVRAANYQSPQEMAFSMVNSLAQKLDCAQVCMGHVQGRRVELLAVSGMAKIAHNSPGLVNVRQAMEECFDGERTILVQQETELGSAESAGHLLHRNWHQETGFSPVLSVPLSKDGQVNSIISLQRESGKPFLQSDVERIESTLAPFGAAVDLLHRARQTTWQKFRQECRDARNEILKPKTLARRLAFIAIVAACAGFVFGWMPFQLTVPCTIEASRVQSVSSPINGILSEVHVRPGDRVKSGEVLFTFDRRDLELQREQLFAELNVSRVNISRAISAGQHSQAALSRANAQLLQVRLDSVMRRLAQTDVRAAFDGTVLRGDLTQQVGATKRIGEPLMELAPDEGWYVKLAIPDSMATYVELGDTGTFALTSRPGEKLPCQLSRVTPTAIPLDGESVFVAEAEADVDGRQEWMRVGMEGLARIDTGWQPVWWVALHNVIDPLRMGAW